MAILKDLYDIIDTEAPFHTAMRGDNVGILVGTPEAEVHRVLVCLDITKEIVLEAASKNVDTIISHHSVIFEPIWELRADSVPYLLAQNSIAALCCHTNLDLSVSIGVNIALGNRLGLQNIYRYNMEDENTPVFVGELEESYSMKAFSKKVKKDLDAESVLFSDSNIQVKKVAFCSGGGGDFLEAAQQSGAEVYLTGELKHHEMLEAAAMHLPVVVAGHFETEHVYTRSMAKYLRRLMPDVGFITAEAEKSPCIAVI